jgi:hypothetical protein
MEKRKTCQDLAVVVGIITKKRIRNWREQNAEGRVKRCECVHRLAVDA